MKNKVSSTPAILSESNSEDARRSFADEDLQHRWRNVVKRRSFLKGAGIAGAAVPAVGSLFVMRGKAEAAQPLATLSPGDAALLRFAAAAELIEADLWQQYNELGGVQGGNPAYIAALSNLDAICRSTSPITPTMS